VLLPAGVVHAPPLAASPSPEDRDLPLSGRANVQRRDDGQAWRAAAEAGVGCCCCCHRCCQRPPAGWVLSTWLVEPPLLAAASGLISCFPMEGTRLTSTQSDALAGSGCTLGRDRPWPGLDGKEARHAGDVDDQRGPGTGRSAQRGTPRRDGQLLRRCSPQPASASGYIATTVKPTERRPREQDCRGRRCQSAQRLRLLSRRQPR
jgi:hypothetical protein